MRYAAIACLMVLLGLASVVLAQEPAKGPADIINRAQQGRTEQEMGRAVEAGEQAAGEPPAGAPAQAGPAAGGDQPSDDAVQQAHAGMDEATLRRMLGGQGAAGVAQPSAEVPAGTIRVRVVDEQGDPVTDQAVRLGIMEGEGDRHSQAAPTDEQGHALFEGLPTGDAQAYRVSVPHEGATYAATPFRLPPNQGYHVQIRRLPVTEDPRVILLVMGQSILELRNERVHVTQHTTLLNMSDRTYVFPDEGMDVRLPDGFTALQSQESMTDQRVETTDSGVRLHGSVPPGRASLAWAFDLPVRGTRMDFGFPLPFRTYQYNVIAEAVPGMELAVDDMPPAEEREIEAGTFLVTQAQRSPDDPPLDYISIRLSDIPGPGPWRWIAVGGGAAFLLAGLFLAVRGGRRLEAESKARHERKEELLGEAVELERMFAREEIGPRYRQRRMDAVLDELAALLKLDDRDRRTQPKRAAADEKASVK